MIPFSIVFLGASFAIWKVWRSFPSKEEQQRIKEEQQRIKEEKLRAKSEGVYNCESCEYTVFKKDFLQDLLFCPECGDRLREN